MADLTDAEYVILNTREAICKPVKLLTDSSGIRILDDPIRKQILQRLYAGPAYPAELAREFKLHEQKIYYHIKQLMNAGLVQVTEKQEIRGTTAKKYSADCQSFAYSLNSEWSDAKTLGTIEPQDMSARFLLPFIKNKEFNANIIVGSPDPHGPFKARARDSHYAINLALFLGKYCSDFKEFSVRLDVDVSNQQLKGNMILVGGPVTNLIVSKLNDGLLIPFKSKENWVLQGNKQDYSDDSIGLIAKFPNPFDKRAQILLFSGIRFTGTKAAVIAITKNNKELLKHYSGEKEFFAVVQGFDLDGDGRIDSTEVLEIAKNS